MFYLLLHDLETRTRLIAHLKQQGIMSVFHYIPLHSSPAGMKYGRVSGDLRVTDEISDRLLRLPLYYDMSAAEQQQVTGEVNRFVAQLLPPGPAQA